MVMTRAQARRERNGGGDASSERSHSSDDNRNGSTNRSAPRRPSAAPPPAAPQPNAPPANEPAEKLGRGCRVARPYVSLDEQYLANALYRTQSNRYSLAHTPDWAEREEEEPQQQQRRYPIREAAKRALEKLHVTLTNPNGAAGQENDGAAEGEENSNSMGVFHFRNHPELGEEIQKHRAKRRKKLRRGGRRGSDSDSTESDSDDDGSSASSSTSTTSSSSSLPRRVQHDHYGSTATLAAAAAASPFSVGSSPRNSGTAPRRPTTTDDGARAVSPDSSITDVSLREESVERAAARDARTKATTLLSASSSDDDTYNNNNGGGGGSGGVDATRDFASEAERRRAQRHARESTNQNVNINFYMADAVGVEDAKRLRRRQRDRRYRWLLGQEEEARARNDGSGIGGSAGEGSAVTTANGALGDILPLRVDDGVTFDSVGGLPEHIVTLREMVLLPLLYPDLFERLDLKAPRGVLFVGPPGTGKTLMARALANEGSRFACRGSSGGGGGASTPSSRHAAASSASSSLPPQRITFFVRKGADMLSKWVGESERQLKLLFEEAKRLQPSIIFFDEVDGLAPTRHAKTEQTQAALVSTLLALLDGLEDRGQVVVIGATNRPDTLDPALRRPGRFDRELIFPLPDAAARRHILTIQLAKKAMPTDVAQRAALLDDLVEMTEGYSGADLGALCTEASLHRLRTALPQLYMSSTRLVVPPALAATQLCVRSEDFYAAAQLMQPSLRRCRSGGGSEPTHLDPYVEVLLRGTRDATLAALAPSWSMVDKVLRAGRRDCRDVESAVRALCAVPIPQPPRPCLLVLQESPPSFSLSPSAPAAYSDQRPFHHHHQQQQRSLHLHHLSVSLLKGLPGLNQLVVNLPQLDWNSSSASSAAAVQETLFGGEGDYLGGGGSTSGDFTHMRQVVLSVRQCSPCVVYLKDADAWLEEGEDESEDNDNDEEEQERERHKEGLTSGVRLTRWQQRRVQLFRFYLNMLADVDAMFLLPCASPAVSQALLGSAAEDAHSRGHSSVAKTVAGEGQSQGDLGSQTASLPDTVSAMSQSMVASSDLFSVESALASPSSPMLVADPPSAVQLTRLHTTTTGPRPPSLLHPQFSVVRAVIAATPLPVDLCRFVAYVHRIVTMTLALHRRPDSGGGDVDGAGGDGTMGERLVEDTAPLPSPLANAQLRARRHADRASCRQLWRKVEYRRLQLRHVLMKWVSQYIHSGKFKLLASADLDFAPDNPLFKAWRHHTRHHRLGLQDILEKVEDEKYVCLSQYHDDIDQLVRSVRSFFRTRAAQDQRYRLRALDLKETCLLNMYKLNREVIRFCEETRDAQEPSDSSDSEYGGRSGSGAPSHRHAAVRSAKDRDDDGHTAAAATRLVGKDDDPALIAEQARRAVSFTQRPAAPPAARKRRREWGHRKRRNRRQQPPRPAQTSQKGKEEAEGENKGDGEAGHESKPEKADDDKDGEADVLSGDSSDAEDSDGHSRSSTGSHSSQKAHDKEDEEEEETAARGSLDANANSLPVALTDDDGDVEWWACRLLSTFAYTRLYRVFKSVMRGLEVEVRVLDEEASAVVVSDARTEAVPCSRETFADGVFRKLVEAAVEEQ